MKPGTKTEFLFPDPEGKPVPLPGLVFFDGATPAMIDDYLKREYGKTAAGLGATVTAVDLDTAIPAADADFDLVPI